MRRGLKMLRGSGVRFALLHTLVFVISVAAVGVTAEALVTRALKVQAQALTSTGPPYETHGPRH